MQGKVDVLINGCGIGGAMLAYLLGRQGHRVLVVEQARRERAINGADLLKPAGIRVVEAAGLLADVLRLGGRTRHELEVYHDGELLRHFDYASVDGRGYFILMPCEALRRLVLERIDRDAPSVELVFETRIEAIQREAGQNVSQVRLSDGRVLRPRVLVGADGLASYVRRRVLDIDVERQPYPAPMLVGTFALAPCVAERNRLYVDSQGGLAYFYPIGFDRARLVVSFPKEESRQLMADTRGESLRRRLQAFVGEESAEAIAAVTGTSRFKGIPIGCLNLDRYWAGNVAMLGDAIHNVHPITGQGMNLAIEDASALADALGSALAGACPLDEALAGYQTERFPVNQTIVSYGHALATRLPDRQAFAEVFDTALQGSSRQPETMRGERRYAPVLSPTQAAPSS
ncbi:FAD-dependent monooxygenase [Pseudomonas mangiferae]|uniref:Monooxygenase n=1 Tax=Pseudomonas mangiferae TaxID=2593654 RepID=A0A553GU29_9PSED|nr:FAD-dependent monooxygenase [Pseudomonas mangiferae]TRX73015.1 monooxygenase [Pseudomonas mangiferae]